MIAIPSTIKDGKVVFPDGPPPLSEDASVLYSLSQVPPQTAQAPQTSEPPRFRVRRAGILPDGTTPRHVLEAPASHPAGDKSRSLLDVLCTGDDPFSLTLAVDFVTFVAKGLAEDGRDISGTQLAMAAVAAELMKSEAALLDQSGLPRTEVVQRWNSKLSEVTGLLSQLSPSKASSPDSHPSKRAYTVSPVQGCSVTWQREIPGVKTCWEVRFPNGKVYVATTYPDSDALHIETLDGRRVVGRRIEATIKELQACGHFHRPTS